MPGSVTSSRGTSSATASTTDSNSRASRAGSASTMLRLRTRGLGFASTLPDAHAVLAGGVAWATTRLALEHDDGSATGDPGRDDRPVRAPHRAEADGRSHARRC